MTEVLEFAKGPLFVATFIFMALGLLRHVGLQGIQFAQSLSRLAYRGIPVRAKLSEALDWLVPVGHLYRTRSIMSLASVLFHAGALIIPVFLVNHIALWTSAIGISWPGISPAVGDVLSVFAVLGGLFLLGYRMLDRGARNLSSSADYLLLLILLTALVSGFMAMHPAVNPLAYQPMLLIHILSAELVFVLIPTTKLSHCVLFPFLRLSSEVYWRMPQGAGERVARELHGEDVRV
jgi:nitrate reductase gamma subunit